MNASPELCCPRCGAPLAGDAAGRGFRCAPCDRDWPSRGGVIELRVDAERPREPEPLVQGDLERMLDELSSGVPFRTALEHLLVELPLERAELLMQALRESRAAWVPLAGVGGGRALLLSDGFSGSVPALALCGFEVTLLDPCPERLAFATARLADAAPGRLRPLLGGDGPRLPFHDDAFDLVVQEQGLPGQPGGFGHAFAECRRVCAGELVLIADNRLAYKRSLGRRGAFHVPGPLEFLRAAVRPARGERTLAGYRRALGRDGFEAPRAWALYPHAREFAQVVALDEELPTLAVGPKERENRLKLAAWALGLFPLLTPSFALLGRRAGSRLPPTARLERVLDALASATGEPRPRAEHLIATRGNDALVLTSRAEGNDVEPAGRWALHVPLGKRTHELRGHHARTLRRIRERFPGLPVPEPLFEGTLEGLDVFCERRLDGLSGPQLVGRRAALERTLADAARHLAGLVISPPAPLDEEGFARLVGSRADLVARHAAVDSTVRALERLRDELRERLVGKRLPLVLAHSDLRPKHLQLAPDGALIGLLDWGTAVEGDLPLYDLVHLIAHERMQEQGLSSGEAWELLQEPRALRAEERAALDDYCGRLGLDDELRAALVLAYPILVGAVAEGNWDYSRPRWLHRQFGL